MIEIGVIKTPKCSRVGKKILYMRTYFLTFVHHLFKTITLWAALHSINTCSCRSVFSSVSTFPSGWDNEARVACSCSSQSSNTCKPLWYSWWTSTSPLALLTAFCNTTDWRHEPKEAVYPFSITGGVDSAIMWSQPYRSFWLFKTCKTQKTTVSGKVWLLTRVLISNENWTELHFNITYEQLKCM